MKLSIIVPVYNVRSFLGECLDSLVNQSLDDYEVILIDDGSSDGSAEIIKDYAERFPEMIRSLRVENGGQGRARNFGIEMAKGDYLGFVDSDDWITPDMYEKLYSTAIKENADVVVCDFLERFSDGRENYLTAAAQSDKLAAAGSACNKLFRSSIVESTRFPEGLWYEDFYFSAILLLKSRKTVFLSEPLYIYRRGQESTMHNNNSKKNLDIVTIMDMLADYMLPRELNDDFEFLLINHVGIDSINRLAQQELVDKAAINCLQQYMKARITKLTSCSAFKRESMNRRIICWLNCKGFEGFAQKLLRAKSGAGRLLSK